jgi:hypothetical protein
LLELGEAALDEMALGVEVLIDWVFFGSRGIVWDYGYSALFGDSLSEVISVVSRVSHYHIGGKPLDQGTSLRRITTMSCGQREANRASQTAYGQMDFGAQASA